MTTLYIDCSYTYKHSINTGIQRVVRNLARHAPQIAARKGFVVKLVALQNGEFVEITLDQFRPPEIGGLWKRRALKNLRVTVITAITRLRAWLDGLSVAPGWKDFVNAPYTRFGLARCVLFPLLLANSLVKVFAITPEHSTPPEPAWSGNSNLSSDILLLADSNWDFADSWSAVKAFQTAGGYVANVIYDLIPLSNPEFCEAFLTKSFARWINDGIGHVNYYICISRSTEVALCAFLQEANASAPTGHFYLGSDLDLKEVDGIVSPKVVDIVGRNAPIFLVVGSLEPRKNIQFVLDAFEHVWSRNPVAKLVLVGHNTWRVDALLDRIEHHALYGSSLFWIRDATDTDLDYLYENATGLIFASMIEGFGLPIVEAMQRGLPVLCSDIPVFREIADGKAHFFSLTSTDDLTLSIHRSVAEFGASGQLVRTPQPWPSWYECTEILLDKLQTQFRMDRDTKTCPIARSSSNQYIENSI